MATFVATVREFVRQRPLGAIGAAVIGLMAAVAVFAPLLVTHNPLANDYGAMLSPPGAQHWLGTDAHGRDVYSRLIYGSRTALLVGFGSAVIGATLGAILGVGSAYFGGWLDLILQRVMDVFLSLPIIILALAVVVILGTGALNVILAITIPMIPVAPGRSLELACHSRDALRGCGSRCRIQPRADHLPPHAAERHGSLPDHADRLRGSGGPAGGLALVPRPRSPGADGRVGAHAPGRGGRLPRPGDQRCRLRLQPVRRLAP